MKKRYRDIHGKAMKWKDTAFGRRHYARIRFFQRAMLHGVACSTMAQIELIQSASAKTPEMKTKKALAIARQGFLVYRQILIRNELTL